MGEQAKQIGSKLAGTVRTHPVSGLLCPVLAIPRIGLRTLPIYLRYAESEDGREPGCHPFVPGNY